MPAPKFRIYQDLGGKFFFAFIDATGEDLALSHKYAEKDSMARSQNIESYVRWRGDVPFSESPFNDVDNLVLSKLAYYDFSVAPEAAGTTGIELGEAFRRYGTSIGQKGILDDSGTFLAAVAAAPRFSHLGLRNYVDIDGVEYGTQFCAMVAAMSASRTVASSARSSSTAGQASSPPTPCSRTVRGCQTTRTGWCIALRPTAACREREASASSGPSNNAITCA